MGTEHYGLKYVSSVNNIDFTNDTVPFLDDIDSELYSLSQSGGVPGPQGEPGPPGPQGPPTSFTIRSVTVPANNTNAVDVTAPAVEGFNFICWIESKTVGFVSASYFSSPDSISSTVWIVTKVASGSLQAYALYSSTN